MVTAVTGFANAAAGQASPAQQEPVLSELAQAALDRLGQMHSDFTHSAGAVMDRANVAPPTGNGPDDLARSLASVSEAFQTTALVQSQIVQFSMATSISQSLGNNLNSFLKGT
ncbi:hypothetical protein [Paracoccus laeviglucosivorans]|uniref:Uncharacterized protein n=1 Tax=Paracoccus laeviglucosivorans TaxID=1197861 RepID=A0A521BF95_9RHOB|nr:hypothetical protein [Paracoccus laeviglucosivorans]SMO45621.1 hypothetical protein SAMN06265221_102261 [Paracoccus laeviglucosivorans]